MVTGVDRGRGDAAADPRFEHAPVALLLADPQGQATAVNARFRRLAGLEQAAARGAGWLAAVADEERAMVAAAWREALVRGGSFRHRLGVTWVEAEVTALRGDDGRTVEHLAVFTDITTAYLAQVELARLHDQAPGRGSDAHARSFRFLIDQLPELVVTADAGGVAEHMNRAFAAYTGAELEDVRRSGLRVLFHPDDAREALEAWRGGLAAGTPFEHVSRVRRTDGVHRWFLARSMPERDPTGRVVRWYVTLTDIDEHKRAEELLAAERNRLFQVLAAIPAIVIMRRGPKLELEWANDRARASVPQGYLERPQLAPEASAQDRFAILRRVMASGDRHVSSEVPLRLPWQDDGPAERFFNMLHEPIRGPGGQVEGVFTYLADVTDHVLARQRAEALAEDLQRAVRVRDDFLSIAGHELKTPLAALELHLQGLQRQLRRGVEPDVPRFAERLDKAVKNLGRLERLVDELLDVSRISAGRITLTLEPVDLVAVVAEVIDRFADDLARCGSKLVRGGAAQLVGRWDRLRVDQVVTNLISNAVKYGAGRPIAIDVLEQAGQARLTVRDEGTGIPEADQARIFGRFERAVPSTAPGGLGLGLWITRRFVEAMGGQVTFTSAPGQGTAFLVELPVALPS